MKAVREILGATCALIASLVPASAHAQQRAEQPWDSIAHLFGASTNNNANT
jgi:hypothetical protein